RPKIPRECGSEPINRPRSCSPTRHCWRSRGTPCRRWKAWCRPIGKYRKGVELLRRHRGGVAGVELRDALVPHLYEGPGGQVFNRLPDLFDRRQRILPTGALAPFLAPLPSLVGGAHRFPGNAVRMADMFGRALGALLMDQIKVAQCRLLMRLYLEQDRGRREFVGSGDGIVAWAGDGAGAIFIELVIAQLE